MDRRRKPRRKELLKIEGDDFDPLWFPENHHLIVTTDKHVVSWSTADGMLELFRSLTGGILAAKRVGEHNQLLAVADEDVIVMHDIRQKKTTDRSYRLKKKSVDVLCSKLLYF